MNADEIEARLRLAYPDCDVAVIDTNGRGDHFDVRVASGLFKDRTRVQRHQDVMGLFQKEFASGELHALQLNILLKS
jgi:stress-induced morphogen